MRIEGWKGWGWTCLGVVLVAQGPSEEGDRARSLQQLRELMTLPVKVATGTPTPWQQTPASVTVITGADLEAMGADTLDEALAMVPGLHVSQSGAIGATRFLFRGVVSYFNPQVLLLVDGVPRVSIVRGDRVGLVGTRIPAAMISRIEVIRGPGSAVYGEEAFAGVIHVHTRLVEGLERPGVGVQGGSFQSKGLWGEVAAESGKLRLGASVGRFETDGHRRVMEADAQSGFDWLAQVLNLPIPAASRAPGPMETGGRSDDAQVHVSYGRFRVGLTQESRLDVGLGQGGASALDPDARIASHRTFLSVAYNPDLGAQWEAQVSASAQRMTQETQRLFHLLPAGALFGAFPEGVLASPGYVEARRRLEGQAVYQGLQSHRLRFGIGVDRGEMVDIREIKNFDSAFQPYPGGMRDVSGTDEDWMPRRHRTSYHGFLQDEWTLGPGTLTTGLRYDQFSDVGHSWNPRLAWVGPLGSGWILKVLHGHAFRAPSHFELWGRNNPVTLGNPDLRPERLITSEVGLGWQPSEDWSIDLNLFQTHIRDFINFKQDPGGTATARNADRLKGQGGELSLIYAPSQRFRITANASYQDTRDEATDRPLGEAPRARAYLRVDRRFLTYWQGDLQATWVGTRPRSAVDPRPDLPGYTTLDAVLRRERLFGRFDVRLTVRNLLDRDVREPSQSPAPGAAFVDIPYDLPQAGRSVMVELVWRGR